MSAVQDVGIVGAGASGLATAILLAEAGTTVVVYEAQPDLAALGSGITLQGNALRALDRLGVWEQVRGRSFSFDVTGIRAPGPEAPLVAEMPDNAMGGPDYPATAGMYRPDLAEILLARARSAGATVRFGTRVTALTQADDAVTLTLATAGGAEQVTHGLVVGADGLGSTVRELIGIGTRPEPNGMGIFRAFVRRPAGADHTELVFGGPSYIAGFCPTGPDTMYAYLVEDKQDRQGLTAAEGSRIMAEKARPYGAHWNDIRAQLEQGVQHVHYTWFTSHLVPAPWNRGRVVVIGDAAHSCPPTVAQGAAQALEDAVVLGDVLTRYDALTDDLWAEFHERRVPRATAVVEASDQIASWLLAHERGDVQGLHRTISDLVSQEP
ncbi:FAD-dependent monooxygenase [Promicromonospora thailandica]|uniref:2-polyprenyl-6-methoxyphenol hydroxylase n=1 Tax=Promicromonospora thailandica TaxID=765201 RepID=A0A9X2G6G1_9MICO|nr:FAD-dependent monooxygenase [Promicromonospora thailandica]MCP2266443.1 2-polyprenyl-6-methoxyphenol hydroxylase [Promicromonospora thailandica]BFF20127.1 FAD-dependent oxidoreductase [Promicromonospora thailandica]